MSTRLKATDHFAEWDLAEWCRAMPADAANKIETLRELLAAYIADENRFNRGQGAPYGSISTEIGMRARAAVKRR